MMQRPIYLINSISYLPSVFYLVNDTMDTHFFSISMTAHHGADSPQHHGGERGHEGI